MAREKKGKGEIGPYGGTWGAPSLFEEMDRMFETFFGRRFGRRWLPSPRWAETVETAFPAVDMYEDDDQVVVKAELPGVRKEDIDVSVDDTVVTISGEKKMQEKVQRKDYYRVERSYGAFTRSLPLPAEVQSDKATAAFKDGVLEVRVPKTAAAKEKKVQLEVR
ncbi:MAG: Hsp20/alpha crystallin family protein [Nitrospirota bacterium]